MKRNDGEKVEIKHVEIISEEDEVEPPPPDFLCSFASLQEWLQHICATENPPQTISGYNFSLFEEDDKYIISLVGLKTYHKKSNHSVTEIVFEPAKMYFLLPYNEHKDLTRDAVLQLLTVQLTAFIHSEQFGQSFLLMAPLLLQTGREYYGQKNKQGRRNKKGYGLKRFCMDIRKRLQMFS